MRIHTVILASLVILASCTPKPKACLDLDETLEAGTFLTLTSCSEDYEFQTWEWSDDVPGSVGDLAQRTFEQEGNYAVRLTAFSDGAYKSDIVDQEFRTSYRYVDYFEFSGQANFDSLVVELSTTQFVNNYVWLDTNVRGNYSEDNPYVIDSYDAGSRIVLDPSPGIVIECAGYDRNLEVMRFSKSFNFFEVKDNPYVVQSPNGRYILKMYWRFRD